MKIIQISDIHIDSENRVDIIKEIKIIDKLYNSIEKKIGKDEKVIFILCGDLFNRGTYNTEVNVLLEHIKEKFKEMNLLFLCVPGNHDLVQNSFDDFNSAINLLNPEIKFNDSNSIIKINHDNINILLINTLYHKDHKYGEINYNELEEKLKEIDTSIILVGHHSLMSRYLKDNSNIRNAYKFFDILNKNKNIVAYMHGHTHSYNSIWIENCKIVGVGPWHPNDSEIPRQFNFIDIKANQIDLVENFIYRSDMDTFYEQLVYKRENYNLFKGDKFQELHKSIVKTVKEYKCIYNFNLNYSNKFLDLKREIEEKYSADLSIAKLWQKTEIPDELYYNHGNYMKVGDKKGIEFVIEELKRKATSSRALISLISLEMVLNSGDRFLPSFDLIQFGFENEGKTKLHVNLYLRALEVNHFLKINFCELLLMIEEIQNSILSIIDVNINILSFKAQFKEKYGCFKKPKIDSLKEAQIGAIFFLGDKNKIKELLEEKLDFAETVIESKGIWSLYNIVISSIENKIFSMFDEENLILLKGKLEILINDYKDIEEYRMRTSNYKEIEKLELKINKKIKDIIDFLD